MQTATRVELLGSTQEQIHEIAQALKNRNANMIDMAGAMEALSSDSDRDMLAAELLAMGADPSDVQYARRSGQGMFPKVPAWLWILDTASMAASAYHGYKRNDSIGWALWWGLMGSMFPIVTPVIAVAQGYGQRHR